MLKRTGFFPLEILRRNWNKVFYYGYEQDTFREKTDWKKSHINQVVNNDKKKYQKQNNMNNDTKDEIKTNVRKCS